MNKKPYLIAILMCMILTVSAQSQFVKVRSVKGMKAVVKMLNENTAVLNPEANSSERYLADQLPAELRKDGLHLIVDGDVGKIPANVRMMGTPFKITSVSVVKAEQKKFKLGKRKWSIK